MKIQILFCVLVCFVLISSSQGRRNSKSEGGNGFSLGGLFGLGRNRGGMNKQKGNRRPHGSTTTEMPASTTEDMASQALNSTELEELLDWLDNLDIGNYTSPSNETEEGYGRGSGHNSGSRQGGRGSSRRGEGSHSGGRQGSSGSRQGGRQGNEGERSQSEQGQKRRGGKRGGRGGKGGRGGSSEEEEDKTGMSSCMSLCYGWFSELDNFKQIFTAKGVPSHIKIKVVKHFCEEVSERLCNNNSSISSFNLTTIEEITVGLNQSSCLSADECEMDECCVVSRSGMRCEKLSSLGDTCRVTNTDVMTDGVHLMQCPCGQGLECQASQNSEGERRRHRGQCVASESSTADPQTPPLPEETTPIVEIPPPIPEETNAKCAEHNDCEFFQCCVLSVPGDKSSGVCRGFSTEGASCTATDTFLTLPIVAACPCQSQLTCKISSSNPTGVCTQ